MHGRRWSSKSIPQSDQTCSAIVREYDALRRLFPPCAPLNSSRQLSLESATAKIRAADAIMEWGGTIHPANRFVTNGRSGPRELAMTIIGWILLGLISGFIASKIVNRTGEGVIVDIILGIVGAIVGGFLFAQFGAQGVTGFNLYSMFVAVIGAIVVLFIYHAVAGRRSV
jgi:uncharacterized membrane protein YeaQ/YmgE (transglycosylase-associated protein family)